MARLLYLEKTHMLKWCDSGEYRKATSYKSVDKVRETHKKKLNGSGQLGGAVGVG